MGKKGNQNNRIFESNLMANGVILGDAPLQMCVQSLCICEMVGMFNKMLIKFDQIVSNVKFLNTK